MKLFVRKAFRNALILASFAGVLTSCGDEAKNDSETSDTLLSFVAVEKTSWDAETTIGSHIYKFSLDLSKDNSLLFKGTCTGEKQQSGGGPGGGSPFGRKNDEGAEISSETVSTDYSSFDFTFKGSWTEKTGYGYILTFSDTSKTTIHVDYNKTQGRHEFYYIVTTSEGSSQILMQAQDSSYRKKLAADYKVWDERDSTYIFTGNVQGNNNSVDVGYIYMHSDNSAVYNTANGSARSITIGLSWEKSGNTIILKDGDNKYSADVSINSKHPGFRLGYKNYSFFSSTDSSISWAELSNEDFDGKTLYKFTGSYATSGPDGGTKEVELNLTDNDSKAFLYVSGNLSNKGTYAFAEEVFTISMDGKDPVTVQKNDEGSYVYRFEITTSSFFGTSTIEVSLTYTPGA